MARFKKVEFSVNEKAELSVQMDISLANVLVSNLIRNAVFHNIPNGKVSVEIIADSFRICNTGSSQELDGDLIFTRFYKPNNSKGTGLGLAIVKAISDLYNLKISYSFDKAVHCFQIEFPNT